MFYARKKLAELFEAT